MCASDATENLSVNHQEAFVPSAGVMLGYSQGGVSAHRVLHQIRTVLSSSALEVVFNKSSELKVWLGLFS